MLHRNIRLAAVSMLAAAGLAGAHLTATGFKPAGGEALKPGETFTISWGETTDHPGGTDIAFSKDGGITWTDIQKNFADKTGTNIFTWTVPNEPTTNGKIRICQLAGKSCVDSNRVSRPAIDAPYILVSSAFTIAGSTGIGSSEMEIAGEASMKFNAKPGDLEVSLGLKEEGVVRLQVFDAQGHLVSTLLDGKQGAGFHTFSIFSNRIAQASGNLVFRLQAGGQVRTQSWNTLR